MVFDCSSVAMRHIATNINGIIYLSSFITNNKQYSLCKYSQRSLIAKIYELRIAICIKKTNETLAPLVKINVYYTILSSLFIKIHRLHTSSQKLPICNRKSLRV